MIEFIQELLDDLLKIFDLDFEKLEAYLSEIPSFTGSIILPTDKPSNSLPRMEDLDGFFYTCYTVPISVKLD